MEPAGQEPRPPDFLQNTALIYGFTEAQAAEAIEVLGDDASAEALLDWLRTFYGSRGS
ncbi:hypothetical protein [Variovorax paradoxus]|uniref:hypothetical protein n=1 Tax=Variovorax paradoxus TaxID=34073 RepID=UPI00285EDDA1|nr:hypothetical protein [Variovorax paradoxus]MDR6453938.1 hypothetical protein [Variovorax paradoxus]